MARAGGRRTRLEHQPEMAPGRAALSRSEGAAGNGNPRKNAMRAILESLATARRTSLRLWSRALEKLAEGERGDHAAIPELRCVNLEPYRKPPVSVVRINFLEPSLAPDKRPPDERTTHTGELPRREPMSRRRYEKRLAASDAAARRPRPSVPLRSARSRQRDPGLDAEPVRHHSAIRYSGRIDARPIDVSARQAIKAAPW